MRRDIVWEWVDRPGLEHPSLDIAAGGIEADGIVLAVLDGSTVRLRYSLRCDARWQVAAASLALDRDGVQSKLTLARDPAGRWHVDGAPHPDLDGCSDIDIMASPFTNTLPIRRLDMVADAATVIRVVYIGVPDLTVSAVDQEYTRLDPATPPRRFRYRNIDNSFVAELAVDADGIVLDYPGLWRRRGPDAKRL
jgi:uncharacterized protein